MSKIHREFLDADPSGRSHAADVLVREEPEDEEDEEDDDEEEDDRTKRMTTVTRSEHALAAFAYAVAFRF